MVRRSKSQGGAALSQNLTAVDQMPNKEKYGFRVLRKEETTTTMRRPDWNRLSALRQNDERWFSSTIKNHIQGGNNTAYNEAEVLSLSISHACAYRLAHDPARKHLYANAGQEPTIVRVDLTAFSQDQVLPFCKQHFAAKFFEDMDHIPL